MRADRFPSLLLERSYIVIQAGHAPADVRGESQWESDVKRNIQGGRFESRRQAAALRRIADGL